MILLFLLISLVQAAQDIPSFFSLSSTKYSLASTNAEKAFFAQTGANNAYHLLQDYTFGTGRSYLEKIGVNKEVGIFFFGYKVYRDRTIIIPIFDSARIILQPAEISINIRF